MNKIKSLSKIKDNDKHLTCVIYQGICSCGNNSVSQIMTEVTPRTDEHEQANGKLEPSKHLKNNPGHKFDWMILSRARSHRLKRKIHEAYFINQLNLSLNDHDNVIVI